MLNRLFNRPETPLAPTPQVDKSHRIYAIGDVHGRHDLLISLFKQIMADSRRFDDGRRVKLLFVGDYIDRGDESAEVLRTLHELWLQKKDDVICLLGNHEEALLRFLADPSEGRAWLHFGARQTLASFGVAGLPRSPEPDALRNAAAELRLAVAEHLPFLEAMRTHYRSGDVLFTHAGVDPTAEDPTEDQNAHLWGHREFQTPSPVPGLCVVHGHYDVPSPSIHPGRINIDTGAYYSGKLTAIRMDDSIEVISAAADGVAQS